MFRFSPTLVSIYSTISKQFISLRIVFIWAYPTVPHCGRHLLMASNGKMALESEWSGQSLWSATGQREKWSALLQQNNVTERAVPNKDTL